mmetsp:Transcript_22753/g.62869  ORF Transcript_22753/g.62869 Transcript_22753/m.62869 type:complete len:203 (-) Transcript_22753:456-1064(-)
MCLAPQAATSPRSKSRSATQGLLVDGRRRQPRVVLRSKEAVEVRGGPCLNRTPGWMTHWARRACHSGTRMRIWTWATSTATTRCTCPARSTPTSLAPPKASPRQLRVLRAAAAKHGAASVPPLEEQKAWQRVLEALAHQAALTLRKRVSSVRTCTMQCPRCWRWWQKRTWKTFSRSRSRMKWPPTTPRSSPSPCALTWSVTG